MWRLFHLFLPATTRNNTGEQTPIEQTSLSPLSHRFPPRRKNRSFRESKTPCTFRIPRGWARTRSFYPVFLARVNDLLVDIWPGSRLFVERLYAIPGISIVRWLAYSLASTALNQNGVASNSSKIQHVRGQTDEFCRANGLTSSESNRFIIRFTRFYPLFFVECAYLDGPSNTTNVVKKGIN